MIDASDLILLDLKEMKKIVGGDLLESLPPRQNKFMEQVIAYNKQKQTKSFYDFSYDKYNKKKQNKDALSNAIRVNKTRVNSYIKSFNLYVDKNFKINKIKISSFKFMTKELLKMLKNKHIKSISIFDAYNNDNKTKIFNEKSLSILKKVLKYENSITIITIFNNSNTKQFYKSLMEYQEDLENTSNLEILYIREPLVPQTSIVYALIEAKDIKTKTDNNYILYYETSTSFSAITPVDIHLPFTTKFYELLERRFNYFFKNTRLRKNNNIIPITLELFVHNFSNLVNKLLNEIKWVKNSKFNSEKEIRLEINNLIGKLKKIKIAYPSSNYSNILLYQQIKMLEITLLLKINKKLEYTRKTSKMILNSGIMKDIYTDFEELNM